MANVYHIAAARLAVFGRRHRSVSSRGYLRLIVSIDQTNSLPGSHRPGRARHPAPCPESPEPRRRWRVAARSRIIFSPHFVLGGCHLGLLHQVVGEMGASRSRYSFGSVVAGWCFGTLTRPRCFLPRSCSADWLSSSRKVRCGLRGRLRRKINEAVCRDGEREAPPIPFLSLSGITPTLCRPGDRRRFYNRDTRFSSSALIHFRPAVK